MIGFGSLERWRFGGIRGVSSRTNGRRTASRRIVGRRVFAALLAHFGCSGIGRSIAATALALLRLSLFFATFFATLLLSGHCRRRRHGATCRITSPPEELLFSGRPAVHK